MAQAADPSRPLRRREQLARWLLAGIACLPLSTFRAMGWVLGRALWLLARERRHIAIVNLRLCFPQHTEAWRRQVVRRHLVVFAQCLLDRIWLWHASQATLASRFEVVGDVSRVRDAPGQVVFAPHFEGMDAGGLWMSHLTQRPWRCMYSVQRHAGMERWVFDGRSRFHVRPVPRGLGIKPLLRGLMAGEVLHLSPDMDLGKRDAVMVPFFAHPHTATVTSLSRLAAIAGVPVCSLVTVLTPGGYRIALGADWPAYPSGDDMADARAMNSHLERWIVQYPEHYHWTHRRFKSQPDGVPSWYKAAYKVN